MPTWVCGEFLRTFAKYSFSFRYHSHPNGLTAPDVYFGRAGAYIITDPLEDALGLPSGKYDVPLAITDKTYASDGSLVTPQGQTINFFGDTIQVNEQPWPYMSVEPRKYRLRIFSMSVSRPFNLYLFDDANNSTVEFQVISSDSGLFGSPVSSSDLVISMGERYELIVDFAPLKGSNITMMNAGFSAGGIQEYVQIFNRCLDLAHILTYAFQIREHRQSNAIRGWKLRQ